jgi:hypothetical protein
VFQVFHQHIPQIFVWRDSVIRVRLAKDANAAKGLLRPASLGTTLGQYVKIVPELTERAMLPVEQLFAAGGSTH